MRVRFFCITFFVLTVVAMGATALNSYFLKEERLRLIDDQAREAATTLLSSELGTLQNVDFERVDNILTQELGDTRVGKLFVIRDGHGNTIFRSTGAKLLNLAEIPQTPQWVTIRGKGHFIRILNLRLPSINDRSLQVGVIVNESLVYPTFFSLGNLVFVSWIFLLGLASAIILTSTLMKPISQLVLFITGISQESALSRPALPRYLARIKESTNKKDELVLLVNSFSSLMEKVHRGSKLSRAWSYQMAHELKTPLAIMEGEIASGQHEGKVSDEVAAAVRREIMKASETVTSFLTWAELESASAQNNLFAVPAGKVIREIESRFATKYAGRVHVKIEKDFYVLANTQYVEHLLLNLVLNALIYSEGAVNITVAPQKITVADSGPGIPASVIDRLGEPFNRRGGNSGGNGLGLAFVHSVCKLYDWKLELNSTTAGTTAILEMPETETEAG